MEVALSVWFIIIAWLRVETVPNASKSRSHATCDECGSPEVHLSCLTRAKSTSTYLACPFPSPSTQHLDGTIIDETDTLTDRFLSSHSSLSYHPSFDRRPVNPPVPNSFSA
ncbi:hypothetical protein VTJ04DRAFT_5995 [Mycothermus thermophilus]|uniref:uncharacterized protein n=1 Tax=Humicola insolens TaxID=85995 RepID=UPI0037441AD5